MAGHQQPLGREIEKSQSTATYMKKKEKGERKKKTEGRGGKSRKMAFRN